MQIHDISRKNSVLNTFIKELRDVNIQTDRMRFRKNVERIGEIMAYEISKKFTYADEFTKTPLGTKTIPILQDNVVICSVLRAGVPLHNGLLNYFDVADNAFISAYRHHKENPENFEIVVEYLASPSLEGKTLILADPMLATGKSMVSAYEALKPMGKPKHIHLASVIGAKSGVEHISKHFPKNCDLWIAAIDDQLDNYGYIVPGLGDAGDLAFGRKLQK